MGVVECKSFLGKKILVTGASSGIGWQMCQQLAREGAILLMISRNREKLEKLAMTLDGDGHKVLDCDVSRSEMIKQKLAKTDLSNIDVLDGMVLCAGEHLFRPFALCNEQHFLNLFSANVLTVTNVISAFMKLLSKNQASIVLLSSAVTKKAGAGTSVYATTKAALSGLVKALAHEFSTKNIRVNLVLPGVINAGMTEGFFSKLSPEQINALTKEHLLGLGTASDVVDVISFLLSDKSRWITGTEVVVDGGFLS